MNFLAPVPVFLFVGRSEMARDPFKQRYRRQAEA